MATRKPSPRNRALRPAADPLESRQLLSKVVSGTDIDGDTWTLKLNGPGSLTVVKQNDAQGNPSPLNATTGQQHGIAIGPVVSATVRIDLWRATELSHGHDQCRLEQSPRIKVFDQRGK